MISLLTHLNEINGQKCGQANIDTSLFNFLLQSANNK